MHWQDEIEGGCLKRVHMLSATALPRWLEDIISWAIQASWFDKFFTEKYNNFSSHQVLELVYRPQRSKVLLEKHVEHEADHQNFSALLEECRGRILPLAALSSRLPKHVRMSGPLRFWELLAAAATQTTAIQFNRTKPFKIRLSLESMSYFLSHSTKHNMYPERRVFSALPQDFVFHA